jgi:mRNA interferase MazF
MGKPVVGEVVVLPFPQTNLQAGKRRPALVVADLSGTDLIRQPCLCALIRSLGI